MNEAAIGAVCVSRAGRDKGRAFVIIGVCDESRALLCDGEVRKLARPKKKKLMHVFIRPERLDGIAELLTEGKFCDADVRKALHALGYNQSVERMNGQ